MKYYFYSVLFGLLTFSSALIADSQMKIIDKKDFSIGDSIEITSAVLNENRRLNIYLPSSYHQSKTHDYPVIYLLDGSADEDFVHLAGLVQFGSFPWINQLPETIVVGIANVDRKRDFTYPTKNSQDKKDFPTTGGSSSFIQFISEELQPFIDKNYRTNSNKTIIGQSLGGLLATEILFKSPELFDNYIIISPSLWWDDGSLLASTPLSASAPVLTSTLESASASAPSAKSIYIGVGKEGEIMERVAKQLFEKLQQQDSKDTIYFRFFEQLSHGDTLHLAVYDAFDKLFRAKNNFVFPVIYRGVWDTSAQKCALPHSPTRVEITQNSIAYWESKGTLSGITAQSPASIQLQLAMSGEGEKWYKNARFTFFEGKITEHFQQDKSMTRVRCESK